MADILNVRFTMLKSFVFWTITQLVRHYIWTKYHTTSHNLQKFQVLSYKRKFAENVDTPCGMF